MASQIIVSQEPDRVTHPTDCPARKYRGRGIYVFENGSDTQRAWAAWNRDLGLFELTAYPFEYPLGVMKADAFDALASNKHHGNQATQGWHGSIAA